MGERPAEIEVVATAAANPGVEPAAGTEQIRAQIEETRDDMSETIDAIQERLSPRNLVEQAKDSVREATVGKVKDMAHNVSDTASGMVDSTREAASDLADRARNNPWPVVMLGLGAAWLMNRRTDDRSRRYPGAGRSAVAARGRALRGGGIADVVRENPLPAALAGLGVGMLAMKAREGSRRWPTAPHSDWRRPSDQTARYQADDGPDAGYTAQVGEQVTESYGRAKQAVASAAERAQQAAGETFDTAQEKVSAFSSQARDASEDLLLRNPLLVGAAAVLAGAAFGLSLPETDSENEWMGEAREEFVERAQEAAHSAVEKVKAVAADAAQNLGQ